MREHDAGRRIAPLAEAVRAAMADGLRHCPTVRDECILVGVSARIEKACYSTHPPYYRIFDHRV